MTIKYLNEYALHSSYKVDKIRESMNRKKHLYL